MKTRYLNIAGALASVFCLGVLLLLLQQRSAAIALNAAISAPGRTAQADEDPRVTLARGLMLAREGDHVGAQRFLQLALQRSDGVVQNQARYNLGNLALRQALKMGSADVRLPATLELAKQQYRDTLQRAPDDLAARYNLERVLWLAPEEGIAAPGKDQNTSREFQDSKSNEDTKDDKERATTTMKVEGGGLP